MTNSYYYPGLCGKYGHGKMLLGAYATPVIVQTAINAVAFADMFNSASAFALQSGAVGGLGAVIAHSLANRYAGRRAMGLTRGAALARRWQAITYGTITATGLALGNVAQAHLESPPPETGAVTNLQNATPASITPANGQIFSFGK